MIKINDLRIELDGLNKELAQTADQPLLRLLYQTGESGQDNLFLYGIVGGKDVGKTSLINLLAGSRISIDSDILDEGTKKSVAYCHQADQPFLQKRLAGAMRDRMDYQTHQSDFLRNVVLIDFPDYDSRFQSHRDDVQKLSRYLQGLVWVITPRKYGDHEFIDQLESVAQSHENYLIILNKIDQLEGRVALEAARREVLDYLKEECARRDIPAPTGDRLLMISALNPQKYEYPRLYERLIRRHSPEEILRAKVKNLRAEFNKNTEKIRSYYALSDRIAVLDGVLDEIANGLRECFDNEYFEMVWQRILVLGPVQHRISSGLFFQRVQHWPVLRLVFHPMAGLISFLGGRMALTRGTDAFSDSPRDLLRRQGKSASSRLLSIRRDIEEKHPELIARLDEPPDYSAAIEKGFHRLLDAYEDRVVKRISSSMPAPGPWRKSLVYLPLIWFPFIQPFLLEWSRSESPLLSIGGFGELISIFISLFGAASLLQSLLFLIVFYLVWLALLYARGARRALREGEEEFRDLWFEEFLPSLSSLLAKPFEAIRADWLDKQARLDRIQSQMQSELNRIEGTQ
ncbi:MAG: hypothetical protein JXR73_23690 [Candidatus Omnitrophica bacterium]|nr:hypothetical protein [Candidatus Omnitrophota bacterium]